MFYDELVLQGADPGANLGSDFSASLAERELVPKDAYLHEFMIGLKHDNATSANTAENSLNILNPFTFKVGQETRIQLRGRDLIALQAFMYHEVPLIYEADAATDDFKVRGIRVPVYETIDAGVSYSWSATRVALSNASGELLELAARWNDSAIVDRPIYAVEQPFTSAGATGRTNLNIQLPKLGEVIGFILFNTTAPTNTADTATVQRLQLYLNGQRGPQYNVGTRGLIPGMNVGAQDGPIFDILESYSFVDLRDAPIDAVGQNVEVEVDVQATSEAVRLIPVMRKA